MLSLKHLQAETFLHLEPPTVIKEISVEGFVEGESFVYSTFLTKLYI